MSTPVSQDIDAMVCWMSERSILTAGSKLAIKHTTRSARAIIKELHYRLDVDTCQPGHRRHGVLDERAFDPHGRLQVGHQAHDALGEGDHQGIALPPRCRH